MDRSWFGVSKRQFEGAMERMGEEERDIFMGMLKRLVEAEVDFTVGPNPDPSDRADHPLVFFAKDAETVAQHMEALKPWLEEQNRKQ